MHLHAYPGTPSSEPAKQSDVAGGSRVDGGWGWGCRGELRRDGLRIQANMTDTAHSGAAGFRAVKKFANPRPLKLRTFHPSMKPLTLSPQDTAAMRKHRGQDKWCRSTGPASLQAKRRRHTGTEQKHIDRTLYLIRHNQSRAREAATARNLCFKVLFLRLGLFLNNKLDGGGAHL